MPIEATKNYTLGRIMEGSVIHETQYYCVKATPLRSVYLVVDKFTGFAMTSDPTPEGAIKFCDELQEFVENAVEKLKAK